MAGTNNFLVFNEANSQDNTMSDADYLADLYRLNGLIPMIADPLAHNKMFRQWSIMITALANIIASMNYNASDADLATLQNNLKSAIEDIAEAKVDTRITTLETWKSDITATTTEINYLTGAESNIQNQINSISGSLATPFPAWIKNTAYAVGDICICTGFNSYKYLECVVAGTTDTTPPVNANIGTLITDNTAKWLVCDWRDSSPVGTIKQDLIVRDGYIQLNGQALNTSDYPRLINFLTTNNLIKAYGEGVTNVDFMYVVPDSSVFTVPNIMNKFIENSTSALTQKNAGLPNIEGSITPSLLFDDSYTGNVKKISWSNSSGAFSSSSAGDTRSLISSIATTSTTIKQAKNLTFNASNSNAIYGNSNTVQPPAVTLIPVIKY